MGTPLPVSRPYLRNRDRPRSGVRTTRYVENRVADYPNIQVPTDGGETWASIPGPPSDDYHRYPSGSSETIGVAGDIIWILSPQQRRHLGKGRPRGTPFPSVVALLVTNR